jgi:hypothetical protein
MVLFIVFLLSKALWAQMDIVGAFQNGTVSIKGKSLFAYHFSLYLNINYTSVVLLVDVYKIELLPENLIMSKCNLFSMYF